MKIFFKRIVAYFFGVIISVLIWTKQTLAQTVADNLGTRYAQAVYGISPTQAGINIYGATKGLLFLIIPPVVLIVWAIGLAKYFKRKKLGSKADSILGPVVRRSNTTWCVLLLSSLIYLALRTFLLDDLFIRLITNDAESVMDYVRSVGTGALDGLNLLLVCYVVPRAVIGLIGNYKNKKTSPSLSVVNSSKNKESLK